MGELAGREPQQHAPFRRFLGLFRGGSVVGWLRVGVVLFERTDGCSGVGGDTSSATGSNDRPVVSPGSSSSSSSEDSTSTLSMSALSIEVISTAGPFGTRSKSVSSRVTKTAVSGRRLVTNSLTDLRSKPGTATPWTWYSIMPTTTPSLSAWPPGSTLVTCIQSCVEDRSWRASTAKPSIAGSEKTTCFAVESQPLGSAQRVSFV